jgi:hypothetical protein
MTATWFARFPTYFFAGTRRVPESRPAWAAVWDGLVSCELVNARMVQGSLPKEALQLCAYRQHFDAGHSPDY